jgi:RND family efflux transporter MFP subunit
VALKQGAPAAQITQDAAKVRAAQAQLFAAQTMLAQTTVRAPIAGTVTAVSVSPGAQVDPTVAIASIADLRRLFVTVNMSEFDVANIKSGDRAIVDVGAVGGTTLAAKVVAVAPVGVSNAGVVQFPVTVAIGKPPFRLRPGMLATVEVITTERKGVLRVPLDTISTVAGGSNDGQTEVTLLDKTGRQRMRFVDLGAAGPVYVEVLHGLKGGERIVVPQVAAGQSAGGAGTPPGIGVPANQDQGNQGGGG